jgi:hypothetical protein
MAGAAGPASAAEPLSRPDWSAIFGPEGKVIDPQGGVDAFFLEDKISDGIGVDMSVIVPADKPTVDNGVIAATNDLGNGYVYARRDASGNLQLYAGIERFGSPGDTYVEFEFHQGLVQVHSGAPWPVHGERKANDVMVRVDFVGGQLSSAKFMRWDGTGYQTVATVAADGGSECNGADYLACSVVPPLPPILDETWDVAGVPVEPRQPNSFVEVGLDVAALLGSSVEFTSLEVRTPQDIILDGFRHLGLWARETE